MKSIEKLFDHYSKKSPDKFLPILMCIKTLFKKEIRKMPDIISDVNNID